MSFGEAISFKVPIYGRTNYDGAQIAALYHLRSTSTIKPVIPYLTAGIGFTSDDWTELPSYAVIRLGGGIKYFFGKEQNFGLKLEARNEIIGKNSRILESVGRINFPSLRAGFIYRF